MILVTGATGHLGGAVTEHLLKYLWPGEFAILARDEKKAKHFTDRGVELRIGNFDDNASIYRALNGITKVLLIPTIMPNRLEQNKNFVHAAVKQGVKHILYAGISHRNIHDSVVQGLDDHFWTEDYIRKSGLAYTFLRNNLYMDIVPFYAGETVFDTGIYLPAGKGRVPYALRQEMGEATANVLLQKGHENKTYEISGSELYSFKDVARVLSGLSGKKIQYTEADPEDYREYLKAKGTEDFIIFILTGFNLDIKNRHFENITNDLEKLLGRKPSNLDQGLKEVFRFNK